tara:strand:+ start:1379 stop:2008 length:630 start_codon:yes stop_codon:yes gene_type:complete
MLVSDIVKAVNIKVDNTVSTRFTETDIIGTVNECLIELAIHTNLFNKTAVVAITKDISTFVLPTDITDIRYAYFDGNKVKVITSIEMETLSPGWRNNTTSSIIEAIIYDEEDNFIVYPTLSETSSISLLGTSTPVDVTALTDTISLKAIYKNILVYYISGILLSNTGRTEDTNRGAGYLKSYNQRLKSISNNITSSLTMGVANYNTPFK